MSFVRDYFVSWEINYCLPLTVMHVDVYAVVRLPGSSAGSGAGHSP